MPGLASGLVAATLFSINLNGTLVFDDVQIVGTDPRIRHISQWRNLWTRDYFNGAIDNLYRPLVSQTYAVQWLIHGNRPEMFHLVNIFLHAVVAFLVARLAVRLGGLRVGWVAGLLFAVHPVHVEAVAEIVGRADEMCLAFLLGGLLLFLGRPLTAFRAGGITLCIVGAVLSKEQGMLYPFILLALALCVRWRPRSSVEKQAGLLVILGCCWPVAGMIILREQFLKLPFEWSRGFLDDATQPMVHCSALNHGLMVIVLLGRYAQLMLVPWKLSIDYGLSVTSSVVSLRDPYFYGGAGALLAVLVAFATAIYKRQWMGLFCLIAAALAYGMISNIILIGTVMGERELYIPSAFFLIWAAMHLEKIAPRTLVVLMVTVISLGLWRTVTYALKWNDRGSFYQYSLEQQPRSVRLCELVCQEWLNRGDLARASAAALKGQQAAPDYWNIWAISGIVAERQHDFERANQYYRRCFDLLPTEPVRTARNRTQREMQTGIAEPIPGIDIAGPGGQ